MVRIKNFVYALGLALLPGVVAAQTLRRNVNDADDIVELIYDGINIVTVVVVSLSVVWIIVGIFQYFIAGGEDERKTGRDKIAYGVLGIAIMFSIWGLVRLLKNTFNTEDSAYSRQDIQQILPR